MRGCEKGKCGTRLKIAEEKNARKRPQQKLHIAVHVGEINLHKTSFDITFDIVTHFRPCNL